MAKRNGHHQTKTDKMDTPDMGTDGIRNNQVLNDVPKDQKDFALTNGIDEFVEDMMDEVENAFAGRGRNRGKKERS